MTTPELLAELVAFAQKGAKDSSLVAILEEHLQPFWVDSKTEVVRLADVHGLILIAVHALAKAGAAAPRDVRN